MATLATTSIQPRGPAAAPKYPVSTESSNPYGFTDQLLIAGRLPPKVTDKYVFFFGYEGSDPHVSLQQWFPSPFTAPRYPYQVDNEGKVVSPEEVLFPTTEHYMMYHKALLMGDDEVASKILADPHPSAAKRFGRQVKNFNAELWKKHADRVVEEANMAKFTQNEDMRAVLLGTGDRILVEASPDDRIWGIGFNANEAEGRESEWGNNGLGKALMKVRERQKQHEA